ncbi:Zinc finger CCHC domain-containing protein 7 [Mortierella sp. GBA39]|nr:Zinc finger CCHC domain-containing protein 7 [Mortierella sp. GBA39]
MDYDDDDYDQYRQYEDEMYKDPTDESEASDEVDSELEDTMLGHIHYSTNVYKKIGTDAKSTDNQEADSADEGDDSSKGSSGHLAEANTPAEDYFKSTKQGAEADSDTEQRSKKSSSPNGASSIQIADDSGDGEEEESKYKVERKRDTQKSSSAAETRIGQNSKGAKGAGSGSDSDMDLSDSDRGGDGSQERAAAQDDEDDVVSDSEDARSDTDGESLDEHFLDLTKTVSGGQEDDNDYDPDAELGHLDDKKFQDCTERHSYGNRCHKCGSHSHAIEDCPKVWRVYVMSEESTPDDVVQYCYNCASLGHFGDACPKRRPIRRFFIIIIAKQVASFFAIKAYTKAANNEPGLGSYYGDRISFFIINTFGFV